MGSVVHLKKNKNKKTWGNCVCGLYQRILKVEILHLRLFTHEYKSSGCMFWTQPRILLPELLKKLLMKFHRQVGGSRHPMKYLSTKVSPLADSKMGPALLNPL